MDIGIMKENRDLDQRIQLGVNSVAQLIENGHQVYVQTGVGDGAGFSDEEFVAVGATIVYSTEEVCKRSRLICRVNTPSLDEIEEMEPGQIICGFAHLSAASPPRMKKLLEREVTVVAYEMLRDARGLRPILQPMSEIAGRLIPQIAARLLESPAGKGLLLAGIPGLPAAEVTILGAGMVGFNAARVLAGLGAQVTVLDEGGRLAEIDQIFDVPGRIRLMYAYPDQVAKAVAFADVLVGAILLPGQRTPLLVDEKMVQRMRPGAAIIDVSIDQGGCIATSRPTSLRDPTFIKHGVTHYCVPNFTALVARTASRALSNVVRPYVCRLADNPESLRTDPELRSATVVYQGQVINRQVATAHGLECLDIERIK